MAQRVNVQNMAKVILETLKEYADITEDELLDIAKEVAKKDVEELKRTSPKGHSSPSYASGWGYKIKKNTKGFSIIVHNKKKPGLTHLLENGHRIVPWGGKVKAYPHIEKVEKQSNIDYENKVKARLSE